MAEVSVTSEKRIPLGGPRSGTRGTETVDRGKTHKNTTFSQHVCCLLRQVRTGQYVCHLSSINPQHGATLVSNFSFRIKRQTPIGARTAPPLKGTRFRKEQERVWKRERGRWTKGARGRLGSWRDPSQLTASHSILRDRPEEINLPTFHGNTKVKHAPRNPRVKLYPQGGQGTQPPALCDTDNCKPPPPR